MPSSRMRGAFIKNVERDVLANKTTAWNSANEQYKAYHEAFTKAGKEIMQSITELMIEVQSKGGEWTPQEVWKFNRFNNLMAQVSQIATDLGVQQIGSLREALESNYITSYLHTSYVLGQGVSIGIDFQKLDKEYVKQAVNYPWSGAMFSDRIWDNTKLLVKNVRDGVTQSMIQGESMAKLSKRINDNINNSEFNAMRVARTEMMRVCYVAEAHSMKDSGVVEEVQYYATIPSERTCPVCGSLHKKIYKIGQEEPLPKHPQCRCTYLPVIREYGIIQGDKNYDIPKSIEEGQSFEDWMKKILKERDKQNNNPKYEDYKKKLQADMEGIKMPKTKTKVLLDYFEKMEKEYKDLITKYYDTVKVNYEKDGSFHRGGQLFLQRFADAERQAEVFYHELGHAIDYNAKMEKTGVPPSEYIGMEYMKGKAQEDIQALYDKWNGSLEFRTKLRDELRKMETDPATSDTFCSLTHTNIQGRWGHSREYYLKVENRMYSETFANLTSLYARGKLDQVALIREHFPQVVKIYDELVLKINKGEM